MPPEQQGRRRLANSYLISRTSILPDPDQPRKKFDEAEMQELTASIEQRGIKQPLSVRWNPAIGKYMVIDGGRRFEAATRLKLDELPCWVQQGDGKDVLIDQIVHNWQRANLRPYETADALARLRDEFGLQQSELCKVTGKPKSEISKLLALHDKVDPAVQQLARNDKDTLLTKRHLYNISKLEPADQIEVADEVRRKRLNAVETEQLVESRSPIIRPKRTIKIGKGIQSRQQRFRTSRAEVLMTFQQNNFTPKDVQLVLDEIAEQILSDTGDKPPQSNPGLELRGC